MEVMNGLFSERYRARDRDKLQSSSLDLIVALDHPDMKTARALTLIAKIVQNLSNLVEFKDKV